MDTEITDLGESAKNVPRGIGFEVALKFLKDGNRINRLGWKGRRKWIEIIEGDGNFLSYIALVYTDGMVAPWTATRCDILTDDWVVLPNLSATD